MRETAFDLDVPGGRIRGYLRPPGCAGAGVAVILPGWIGYCAGPHRILYELAESLADRGAGTLRFDYLGRGDSDGGHDQTTFRQAVSDTVAVASHVERLFGGADLHAVGMCFGAAVALRCCDRWRKMALWSPEVFRPKPTVRTRLTAAWRRAPKAMLRLCSPVTWVRMVAGKVDLGEAYKYYTRGRRIPFTIELPQSARPDGCEAALIAGDADTALSEVRRQHEGLCKELGIPLDIHVIEGADHSFCSVSCKRRVIRLTTDWLTGGQQGKGV